MRSRAGRRIASSCPVCAQTAPRAPLRPVCRQAAPKDPLGMCPAGICCPISRDIVERVTFLVGLVKKLQRTRCYRVFSTGIGVPGLRYLCKRDREVLVLCSVLCADPFALLPYPPAAWVWQDWL